MDQQLSPAKDLENKVKKLALKYEKGAFSYLYWPCTMNLTEERLHVTGKFFGDTPILVEEVREALDTIPDLDQPINPNDIEWEPCVFATKNDGAVAVIELKKYPPIMDVIHSVLSKFRRDDYASYRPHITVSQDVWNRINDEKLTPAQVDFKIMPLELAVKGLVKYKWGPEGGPTEEIDGEDVHTNNPTVESLAVQTMNAIKSIDT